VEVPNAVEISTAAVSAEDRAVLRGHFRIGAESRFILFLGRLHPIKRLDLLARAFRIVAAGNPNLLLVIAGDGPMDIRLRVEEELGAAHSRVRWLAGVVDRTRDALLSEATALVLCSDSENFGMSVAEALAAGVVPIVTQTCPWEMLQQAGAGFWVPQTADAIADALRQVLASPEAAAEMGRRGKTLVAERFLPSAIGARWATEYARIAG
jgi:glycosyltransferase involved in cell wall biosynthesis